MQDAHALGRLTWPAFWLGFALSGFFDGILLHQVLQWHHLLSAIRGDDIRFQILMDGYFHLLMYVISAFGLWALWRVRAAFKEEGSSRRFWGWLLVGFGVWHFLDAVASHWVLGIHRIKLDAENPMLYDVGWLMLFGVIPLTIGWVLKRGGPRDHAKPNAIVATIAVALVGAGYWSSLPAPGHEFTTIVFSQTVSQGDALSATLSASDALTWFDGNGVYVVTGISHVDALALYTEGALLVSGSGAAPGCFNWTA